VPVSSSAISSAITWETRSERARRAPAYSGATASEPCRGSLSHRPLWGVADTAPYLHDGRAATLDEAIRLHAAKPSVGGGLRRALPDEQADLRIFLLSLTRYPRIDYR